MYASTALKTLLWVFRRVKTADDVNFYAGALFSGCLSLFNEHVSGFEFHITVQARIQYFAQGGTTAKRSTESMGPRCQGPKGTPIKNQKVCGLGRRFFRGGGAFTFLFSYIYYLISFHFTPQGEWEGSAPVAPLDTSLYECTCWQKIHHIYIYRF